MSFVNDILTTLRQRRLWPIPLLLLVGIVAVPLLLSKKASTPTVAQLPAAGQAALGAPVPVTVKGGLVHSNLPGKGRDPFTQQRLPKSTTGSTASTGVVSTGSTATSGTGFNASSGGTGTTTGGATGSSSTTITTPPTSTGSNPPSITGGKKPTTPPPGLTATQAYHVTLAITNSSGGLNTIDPLQRLSPLPSTHQPLLIQLGVLKGGHRVLFAVAPGTVVSGTGTCTPGPIDCEILSLAQDQTEQLSVQSGGAATAVALFAVTGITADQYPTAAAANHARLQANATGRRMLANSSLSALSLFQYEPSIGAVVDLRNLTVGGS